jgi:hypothetical protein
VAHLAHDRPDLFRATGAPVAGYAFSLGVVTVALVVHYVLGIVFGVVMAWVLAQLDLDTTATHAGVAGGIMGVVLYLVNFELLWVRVFPWLHELRGADTMAAHVVFGAVAGLLYWKLKRTPSRS